MVRADGLPKPEIKWYCNGKPISNDENHFIETITETQVTSKLTITNFGEENAGIVSTNKVKHLGYNFFLFFSIKQWQSIV